MEATTDNLAFIPSNYMKVLSIMSDDTKLRIIRMLTDSLIKHENTAIDPPPFTAEMLKKHAGAWMGNETADEIMTAIRENSSIRKPLDL